MTESTSPLKTYVDDSSVIAARFPQEIVKLMDDARNKMAQSGPMMARSAFIKSSVYWYLSYLGYKVSRPTIGGRRTTKES